MAVRYERVVEEDLNLGFGTVDVTMPGGGTAVGHQIGPQSFIAMAFVASRSTAQAIVGGAGATVVQLSTEELDSATWFSTSTYKFLPNVTGKYHFDAYAALSSFTGTATVSIAKNGTTVVATEVIRVAATGKVALSALIELDGDDDYVTLTVASDVNVNVIAARLDGFLVGKSS